jgi:hypothetical protein
MSQLSTYYTSSVPPEVKAMIEPLLDKHRRFLPRWVESVRFIFRPQDDEKPGKVAQCSAYYHYRSAEITIFSRFQYMDQAERENDFAHELLHVTTAPLVEYCESVVNRLLAALPQENKLAADLIKDEMEQRLESLTQDLTIILRDLQSGAGAGVTQSE